MLSREKLSYNMHTQMSDPLSSSHIKLGSPLVLHACFQPSCPGQTASNLLRRFLLCRLSKLNHCIGQGTDNQSKRASRRRLHNRDPRSGAAKKSTHHSFRRPSCRCHSRMRPSWRRGSKWHEEWIASSCRPKWRGRIRKHEQDGRASAWCWRRTLPKPRFSRSICRVLRPSSASWKRLWWRGQWNKDQKEQQNLIQSQPITKDWIW